MKPLGLGSEYATFRQYKTITLHMMVAELIVVVAEENKFLEKPSEKQAVINTSNFITRFCDLFK